MKVALINPKKEKEKKEKKSRRRRKPSFQFLAKINPSLPALMEKVYLNPTEYTVRISKKRKRARRNPDIMKQLTDKNTLIGVGVGFAASRFLVPKIAPNIPFIKDNPQYWNFLTPAAGGVIYLVSKGKMKNVGLGVAVGGIADMLIQKFTGASTMQAVPSGGVSGLEEETITEAVFPPPPEYYDEPLSPEEEAGIQELAAELGVSSEEELGFLRWLWRRVRRGVQRMANIGKIAPAWTPVGAAARIGERLISSPPKRDVDMGIARGNRIASALKNIRLRGTITINLNKA